MKPFHFGLVTNLAIYAVLVSPSVAGAVSDRPETDRLSSATTLIQEGQSEGSSTMPEDKVMVSPELETVEPESQAEKSVSVETAISDPEITEKSLKPFSVKDQPIEIAQYPNAPADVPNLPPMPGVTPGGNPGANGVMVPNPEVIIRSNGTPANPSIIYPTVPVAPVLPRAVAPPVGDMSISNINTRYDLIDLGPAGQAMIPRLVLRQAPVREVLLVLARYAGMNIIFTDGNAPAGATPAPTPAAPGAGTAQSTISLDLENEPVQDVFNSVLMVSGLKANKRGQTIFIGSDLPAQAMNLVSRTLRLNQVKSFNAGTFLASQGAEFQRLVTKTEDITDPLTGRVIGRREVPSQMEAIKPQTGQAGTVTSFLLEGLRISSDDRLNSITLIGEPRQVEIATSLLTQLDARRRQVAVNVKIVDIDLNNTQDYRSSFSFGYEDSYFVQDQGTAVMRFGQTAPVTRDVINSATGRINSPPIITNPFSDANTFLDTNNIVTVPNFGIPTQIFDNGALTIIPGGDATFFNEVAGISTNPFVTGLTDLTLPTPNVITIAGGVVSTTAGQPATATGALPSYFQYPKRFQAQVEAQIRNGNAKVLTDPTLVVQEGQQATVKLTQKVVESVNTQVDPLSGVRTTTPVLADAGLTVTISVDQIDDNGFIGLSVSPTIAAPGDRVRFDSGPGSSNELTLLNRRELTSGLIRLRDGQTLILTGIITQQDRSTTSKVPILGDLPVIGALFRSQTDETQRSEVVVMLTPQIMSDSTEAQFGYNYTPGKATADFLRQQGFPVQAQP